MNGHPVHSPAYGPESLYDYFLKADNTYFLDSWDNNVHLNGLTEIILHFP